MNPSKTIAAGVTAVLVPIAATPPQAQASTVYAHSDLVAPATSTQFVTLVEADLHRPPRVLFAWGSNLPAGPHDTTATVSDPPDFDSYCLVGLDSVGGVMVSFADPAAAIGQPFSSVFPGFSEAQVADALLSGGGTVFDSFLSVAGATPGVATHMDVQCYCVHFSDGAAYGSFTAGFNPVPAPGAALVAMTGPIFLLRRRRAPA